jgi:DNA mismatch repair protein MutL
MPRIVQLSSQVVNQIAAGEVIERPASVVKELLENSLDAGATRIDVELVEGGAELIRVVDDGTGIESEDLPLAVASHATSKLRCADDLFRVRTMGFRGEALASIAEVSRLRLRSRTPMQAMGAEIEVTAGVRGPVVPCGAPVGTTVEVRDLFLNVPVRRKFLRQSATEVGHVIEQFTRIALGHRERCLVLKHQQRLLYELPATNSLLERIQAFFGGELTEQLIEVESEFDGVRLCGYVGHPAHSKATRKGQYLFLNGRCIQDRALNHALNEAYRGLLMVGRNPVAFLYLEMPSDRVDVNVHPTKVEVRFRDGQRVYRQLLATIRNRFLGMDLQSRLTVPAASTTAGAVRLVPHEPRQADAQRQDELRRELAQWAIEQTRPWGTPGYEPQYGALPTCEPPARSAAGGLNALPGDSAAAAEERSTPTTHRWDPAHDAAPAEPLALPPTTPPAASAFPGSAAAALGAPARATRAMQVHDAYLVVETPEGLTVVDQHALHERILYEQLRRRVLAGDVETQRLLMPVPVELSAAEAAALLEHRALLGDFGLCVEEFGAKTVLLSAYPALLSRAAPEQIVKEIAERILETGRLPERRDLIDELLHMMACKGAIKAGQRLSGSEIEDLLVQRHLIDDAHHCPHGRPTALVLSRMELERQFGRSG